MLPHEIDCSYVGFSPLLMVFHAVYRFL
uniref:Uncharacterized protein n=1 Tax=Rhizophora mucronata TaxID=61149 RepID=A0A2P2PRX2_RHIMU